MTTVLIDDRAGSQQLIKYPPLDKIGVLTRLESGDVQLCGKGASGEVLVGIELKSLSDLLSSMSNGRLQASQVPLMLDTYSVNWLLYYGPYRCGEDGNLQFWKGTWRDYTIGKRTLPFGYLESFLLTLTSLGFHVKHVGGLAEAAQWIGVLARWSEKEKHKAMQTFDRSGQIAAIPGMDQRTKNRMEVAKEFPGVGYGRAVEFAKHFGSIREMVNAGPKEWQKVPGAGKVIAAAIEDFVT